MDYRRLGRTGLRVSTLGLGSGGASRLGQAHGQGQAEITRLVQRALDLGVTMVDTSPLYMDSEALLGVALAGTARDSYVLSSKVRPLKGERLLSVAEMRASVELSLRRLRTDWLDVLYLHAVHPAWASRVDEHFYTALQQLQRDGLVRYLGISEHYTGDHGHTVTQAAIPRGLYDVVMVGYNILTASPALHVLPLAQEHNIGVVVMCAVRGVLASPDRAMPTLRAWQAEGLLAPGAVSDDDPLGWLLGPDVESLPAAAYKFTAAHPAVSCVLTGAGTIEHLEANIRAIEGPPLAPAKVARVIELFAPVGRNAGEPPQFEPAP